MLKQALDRVRKELNLSFEEQGTFDGRTWFGSADPIEVISPVNGETIARISTSAELDYRRVVDRATHAFEKWRLVPAPKRGEVVRQYGDLLRQHKEALGMLVTIEMGKSVQEGLGEVQEMIDILDMATGQSRMLYGVQTHSERADHRMFEQWHPLGNVGIVSAFNFPVAVWAWNTALALICGDSCLWKPSSLTPLCAIACVRLFAKILQKNQAPEGLITLVIGKGSKVGNFILEDQRIPLVSYTGSVSIGRQVAGKVATRLGRTILELGGNNAVIVSDKADIELAAKSILFGAVGTAGQRCTSTRRAVVHKAVYPDFVDLLKNYYQRIRIGNPLDPNHLMGPMVNRNAVDTFHLALGTVVKQGGKILWGGDSLDLPGGCYVKPAVAEVEHDLPMVKEETFAPLLYLIRYSGDLTTALAFNNEVPQGLSSSLFSNDLRECETFLSGRGSDCGIANINTGTSGAEIGLAFGGEKETGGGRESGSDCWKYYMRRQSSTINWSGTLELAQGITFAS